MLRLIPVLFIALAASCTQTNGSSGVFGSLNGEEERNKKQVLRIFDQIWNQGNLDVADSIISPYVIDHYPLPGQAKGPAGLKQKITLYRSAIPDLTMNIELLFAKEDKVAVRWFSLGTNSGRLFGYAPTNQPVRMNGIIIYRFVEGQVAEVWENFDYLGLLGQISGGTFRLPHLEGL